MKNCELKQRDDAAQARRDKEEERDKKRREFEAKQEEKKSAPKKSTYVNSKFAALEESSSSDEDVEIAQPVKKATKKSYSEMAAVQVATPIEAPPPPEVKEVITLNDIPNYNKKSILERLRESMPVPVSACVLADDAKMAAKELIREKRREIVRKYKAEGKQVPWAILDEYNTDSDSDTD
jgi:hypothetical protein